MPKHKCIYIPLWLNIKMARFTIEDIAEFNLHSTLIKYKENQKNKTV